MKVYKLAALVLLGDVKTDGDLATIGDGRMLGLRYNWSVGGLDISVG